MKRLLFWLLLCASVLTGYGFLTRANSSHRLQTSGTETWTTATALKQAMSGGQVYWNGYIWSGWQSRYGLTAFDGTRTVLGGKTLSAYTGYGAANLYATQSGLFAAVPSTQILASYNSKSASFSMGEQVQQVKGVGANAIGYVYKDTGTVLSIEAYSGTFDGTHAITGVQSGATSNTTSIVTNSTAYILEWSPDGWTDFVPVTSVQGLGVPYLPKQLCDCGMIRGPIQGHSNVRVLLLSEYTEGNPTFYYCLPDIDVHKWIPLFTGSGAGVGGWPGSTQSIRHFHGQIFVPGIGAKEGRLFVMCGDADFQAAILTCDDIADLCNNGSTWASHWGMKITGPARASWFSANAISQVSMSYSNETATFTPGEMVTQTTTNAVGYVVSDTGGVLTINEPTGSLAFSSNPANKVKGANSSAQATPSSKVTRTMSGGKQYCIGTNPYPLAPSASVTGLQGMGGQDARAVNIVVDSSRTFGYYVPDQAVAITNPLKTTPPYDGYLLPNGVNYLRRIDLKKKTVTTVGSRVVGEGWTGCLAPDGTVLISTDSDYGEQGVRAYNGNCDSYVHLYALANDNATLYEIQRFQRADYLSPTYPSTMGINKLSVCFGAVWGYDQQHNFLQGDPIGFVSSGGPGQAPKPSGNKN